MQKTLSRTELAKENRRLLKNIRRRFSNIEKRFGGASPALKSWKKTELIAGGSTKNLSYNELLKQHRQLIYFEGLKTSRIKGVKEFLEHWGDISDKLGKAKIKDPEIQKKFDEVYKKFVSDKGILEKFKYNVQTELSNLLLEDEYQSDDYFLEKLEDFYDNLYNEDKEELDDVFSTSGAFR